MLTLVRSIAVRLRKDTRGAQVVEFAIVVPLLLMLVMGMIDFGRGFFSYIIITNAAREGARVAAVGGNTAAVVDRVEDAISGLSTNGAPTACPPSAGVNRAWCIQTTNLLGSPGAAATVRVEYNFQFLVPGFAGLTTGVFPLIAESSMRLEG
jgi:Flp pilus assembly protein TadG